MVVILCALWCVCVCVLCELEFFSFLDYSFLFLKCMSFFSLAPLRTLDASVKVYLFYINKIEFDADTVKRGEVGRECDWTL